MLGLRGVRLGLVVPGLYALQVRALAEATLARIAAGGNPKPEIMVPLVGSARELLLIRDEIEQVLTEASASAGRVISMPIGTMIELPRAALTAHRIAEVADFFSFGTNDLTQTTLGFSRDDAEKGFLGKYLRENLLTSNPFETLDVDGVGRLIRIAAADARPVRPDIKLGICGEHGGDPASIEFCHGVGLDYVSCSPFRVQVARIAAGQAALRGAHGAAA